MSVADELNKLRSEEMPTSGSVDIPAETARAQSIREQLQALRAERAAVTGHKPIAARHEELRQGEPTRFPVGSLLGGLAAAVPQTRPLGLAWRMLRAFGGGAAGEAGQQGVEAQLDIPGGPTSTQDRLRMMGTEGALQAAGEGIGLAAGRGVGQVAEGMRRPVDPEAARALVFAKSGMALTQPGTGQAQRMLPSQFADVGEMPMTVGRLTGSPTYDVLENLAAGSLLGSPVMSQFTKHGEAAVDATARIFADTMGKALEPDDLGRLIVGTIERHRDTARGPASVIYKAIEKLTEPIPKQRTITKQVQVGGGITDAHGKPIMRIATETVTEMVNPAPIRMKAVRDFAEPLRKVAKEINNIGSGTAGDELVNLLATLKDEVSYGAAKSLRTRLRSEREAIEYVNKRAPAIGVLTKAEKLVDQATEQGLERFNPEVVKAWRKANYIWARTSETYNNDLMVSLAKAADKYHGGMPEKVVADLLRADVSDLERARTALRPHTEAFRSLKRAFIEHLYNKAGLNVEATLRGKEFEQLLIKPENARRLRVLFEPNEVAWLREFSNLAQQQQKIPSTKLGSFLIQMKQGNLMMQLVGGGLTAGAGHVSGAVVGFVITPGVLAHLAATQRGRDILVRGMKMQASDPQAAQVTGQFVAALIGAGVPTQTQPEPSPVPSIGTRPVNRNMAGQPGRFANVQ